MKDADYHVGEVLTEIVVSEGVGSLSPAEVRKLVALVLEHVQGEQDRIARKEKDTVVRDRASSSSSRGLA